MQFVKSAVSFSSNAISTYLDQLSGTGIGPAASLKGLPLGLFLAAKLDHGQSAEDVTICAWSGLASMYRNVLK